jgi:hypothetical protein
MMDYGLWLLCYVLNVEVKTTVSTRTKQSLKEKQNARDTYQ